MCCELRVELLVAAEPGGREKGRRKGFEVKLNPMRVGRAEGRGNWAHFSGWKSQSGEEMGSGRMEATCGHRFSHRLFVIWMLLLEWKVPVFLGQEVLTCALQGVTRTVWRHS